TTDVFSISSCRVTFSIKFIAYFITKCLCLNSSNLLRLLSYCFGVFLTYKLGVKLPILLRLQKWLKTRRGKLKQSLVSILIKDHSTQPGLAGGSIQYHWAFSSMHFADSTTGNTPGETIYSLNMVSLKMPVCYPESALTVYCWTRNMAMK